jgi:hypothetical protein
MIRVPANTEHKVPLAKAPRYQRAVEALSKRLVESLELLKKSREGELKKNAP